MNHAAKLFLFVLLATLSNVATASTFDNRVDFESSLASFVIDDFEDITAPDTAIPSTPSAETRSGYSLSDTGFASLSLDAAPSGINNFLDGDTVGGILNQQNALIITFDSPITAVGFEYGTNEAVLELRIGSEQLAMLAAPTGGFMGYTSETPFTEVQIFNNSSANAAFNIDNLTFGNVPEPSAGLLTLIALTAANIRFSRK